MNNLPIPSIELGVYYHYKDPSTHYKVLGVGRDTETEENVVVYAPLESHEGKPDMWVRPYDMFIGTVEVNGAVISRFQKING